ncbi:metalloproteinase [Colwellia sp. MT41]|uniref:imelysin family protein n=1 Tax=Colwellia sp. MT41 TaxID=58049 RepID=UPI000717B0AF|nr:imelysin family protein [Colwellia sp. MT41]ALO33749.1 metalloproteinase [Colwellia sp. MT41]
MKFSTFSKISAALIVALSLTACVEDGDDGIAGVIGADGMAGKNGVSTFVTRTDVIKTNANIAYAAYADSLISATTLKTVLETFVAEPTEVTFALAKKAWLDSREPYGQTEVYRFRQGPIDELKADGTLGKDDAGEGPEGLINAWPLGEAIIDYVEAVDGLSGPESPANAIGMGGIIAAKKDDGTFKYATIDATTLSNLFEHGEDGRNVTTGYHAIEFLLWGQDLNKEAAQSDSKVHDNTPGQRPFSDFNTSGGCTSGLGNVMADEICTRRGQYLVTTAELLIKELTRVTEQWEPVSGAHYKTFVAGGDVSLAKILEGMGRLSFGELAGERINVALIENSQEDEHSCFSDNTHRDIFLNAKGVQNSFNAKYVRIDGEVIEGASIYDLLVVEGHHELANKLRGALEATMSAAAVIDTKAKTGTPFDVLMQEGIAQPNIKAVIDALVAQTDDIEAVIDALGVTTNDLRDDTEQTI